MKYHIKPLDTTKALGFCQNLWGMICFYTCRDYVCELEHIYRNLASLSVLVHDVIKLLNHEHWPDKQKYFYV